MKKLAIAALALSMTMGVNAQEDATTMGSAGTGAANLTAFGIAGAAAIGVTVAVAAAIISNAQAEGVLPTTPPITPPGTVTTTTPPQFTLVCKTGDAAPVAGVCTTTSSTVTVTGTGTATSTITVPVVITYPAIVTRV
ncbi:hypothetical protein [Alishewanella tabrizica]|uniref:Secreted protein n=1 Tax=Alishewanella tabrizica TaxID=671278 RepID=A0ABQ2WIY4_9ALTE|nr:hypothetical protein [Alishewanella tabrizica]GGW58958.1 hypothetical protein GCM10008111_13720 [Alishewanella tabrizica]